MREQKNEFLLWIGILGLVGLFIFFMPSIERLIFGQAKRDKTPVTEKKEETKVEETTTKSGKITCGATTNDFTSVEYVVYYEDSKATKLVSTETSIYTEANEDYNKNVSECNKLMNNSGTGYTATCDVQTLKVTQKETFDLKTFKDITITNSDKSTSTISTEIKYNQDIKEVENYFKSLGTTCK